MKNLLTTLILTISTIFTITITATTAAAATTPNPRTDQQIEMDGFWAIIETTHEDEVVYDGYWGTEIWPANATGYMRAEIANDGSFLNGLYALPYRNTSSVWRTGEGTGYACADFFFLLTDNIANIDGWQAPAFSWASYDFRGLSYSISSGIAHDADYIFNGEEYIRIENDNVESEFTFNIEEATIENQNIGIRDWNIWTDNKEYEGFAISAQFTFTYTGDLDTFNAMVPMVSTVPEPATASLLGLTLVGILRRRKHQ